MSRNRIATLGFAVLGLTLLACASVGGSSTLPAGEIAPNFGIQTGGRTITLRDLRGKVVIVSFWSST